MGEKEVFHEAGKVYRKNQFHKNCKGKVPKGMDRRNLRYAAHNYGQNTEFPCRVRDKAFPAVVSSIIKNKRICGVQSKSRVNYISLI